MVTEESVFGRLLDHSSAGGVRLQDCERIIVLTACETNFVLSEYNYFLEVTSSYKTR